MDASEQTTLREKHRDALEIAVWSLGVLSLAFSLWAVTVGWHNSILDFREAQTAISADSILHGGPILRYETPVLGPPWSVPFEFPLYQVLVAGLAKLSSTPIDQTGRFISLLFYYLSFFPLAAILSRLGLRHVQTVPTLALFAASPFYIFFSRWFLIESTALFFSLMYVDGMLRLARAPEGSKRIPLYIAEATLCGVLAGLVKVTTFAPFFVLGALLVLSRFWKDREAGRLHIGLVATVGVLCCALPVVLTAAWTKFADAVKGQNPMGAQLTSKALQAWSFGTLAQRLHPRDYFRFVFAIDNMVGSVLFASLVLIAVPWLCLRSLPPVLACMALYAGTIELFFNLHYVHQYYAYSNAIFIVAAVGLLLGALLGLPGRRAWVGVALFAGVLVTCSYRYFHSYYTLQNTNAPGRPSAAALIDRTTRPEDVILITGLYWSSEFPYQSHRRAIMAFWPERGSTRLQQAIANEGPTRIAAVVVCDEGRSEARLPGLLQETGMPRATAVHADNCDIYER